MTAYALRTRRMVLRDMGKAGLAVLVLGTAACADTSSGEEQTTSAATDDNSEGQAATSADATTSTQNQTAPTPGADAGSGFDWQRVNLGFVSAYILYRSGEAVVVDTGVEGSEASISGALSEAGLGWDDVGHVVITHKHPDHQGSLEAVLAEAPDASWYAGAGDMAAISAPSEGIVVTDGETVFDLEIVETPGHTPGHISVLDPVGGILIAGDALNGANGGVTGANPDFSEDMGLANASLLKLAGFDYQVVLFGHGEPVLENASEAVSELASGIGH